MHGVQFDGLNRKFGISYHVEGDEIGKRRYHVDQFEVAKRASKVTVKMDKLGAATAFQVVDGVEREIQSVSNVFDESLLDKESKLDKAVKVSQIFSNLGEFVGGILGAAAL